MDMHSKLTIIIPTCSRHAQLARLLDYFADFDFHPLIRVLDSTPGPEPSGLLKELLRRDDLTYTRFAPDMSPALKICQGAHGIDTPYALFCADDDILCPEAITDWMRFLEKNPAYASCMGTAVEFRVRDHSIEEVLARDYYARDADHCDDLPGLRLGSFFSRYHPLFYAVHRSESVANFLGLIRDVGLLDPETGALGELALAFAALIGGGTKVLDSFGTAREMVLPLPATRSFLAMDFLVQDVRYRHTLFAFRERVANLLARTSGLDPNEALIQTDMGLDAYLHLAVPAVRRGMLKTYKSPKEVADDRRYPFGADPDTDRRWNTMLRFIEKHHALARDGRTG